MVRQRGSQTAGGVAAAAGIPPGWSAYVPEAGFPRRGLEYRRRENKTPGLRLTYRPCCFLLGVSGGSRTAGAAHPPPALRRTGTRHLIGARQSGARQHRGPAVSGPAVSGSCGQGLAVSGPAASGSGGIGAWRSGVRQRRGLAAGSGGVGVWWAGSGGAGGPGVRGRGCVGWAGSGCGVGPGVLGPGW